MEIKESDWPTKASPREHKPWNVLCVWDDGLYMYQQAAHEIADARGWSDDRLTALLEKMAAAINNGTLTTHDRKTSTETPLNRPEFFGLVTAESVNKWLAATKAIYRWSPQALVTRIEAGTAPPDAPVVPASITKPWLMIDPADPIPAQSWYSPARYFARQLVLEKPTLLSNRALLAEKVTTALFNAGIKKRGGIRKLDSATVLKAFVNVTLG